MLLDQPPLAPAPVAGAASAAVRAPDTLDRVQAPPTVQPQRQAAHQAPQQNPAAPSNNPGTGAPDRRTDAAAHASQRDAQQDYVMQVVRSCRRRSSPPTRTSDRSPRGALIARLTVDRGGNLIGLSLVKDSGSASVDRSILEKVRKTAPFPPLPQSLRRDQLLLHRAHQIRAGAVASSRSPGSSMRTVASIAFRRPPCPRRNRIDTDAIVHLGRHRPPGNRASSPGPV